jgi:hypothetical protein
MNHEHETHEQLPTVKGLFRRAGELAVLHGRIDDIDNDNETLREFVLDKFPQEVRQKWPKLREITYTPSYMVDYAPSGDMLSITLVDEDIRSRYTLERNEEDSYDIIVDHSPAEELYTPYISQEQRAVADTTIAAVFSEGSIQSDAEAELAEKIDFLLTSDITPTLKDILMLDELITSLADQYSH